MTNIIQIHSPMTQKQITTLILQRKRAYAHFIHIEQNAKDYIRLLRRQIKLTCDNPFFKHRHSVWQNSIEQLKDSLKQNQSNKHQIQEILVNLIQQFDEVGPAPVHVYGAILSIHHVHIERALTEGANSLMDLIFVSKVEGAHTKADIVSDDAILHDAVAEVAIREILRNKEFKRTADSLIQRMAQESLGRPLRQYQFVRLPNGHPVAKPMQPNMTIV